MAFSNTLNMVQPILNGIGKMLPEVYEYLNARIKQTKHIKTKLNGPIKDKWLQSTPKLGEYGLIDIDDLTHT